MYMCTYIFKMGSSRSCPSPRPWRPLKWGRHWFPRPCQPWQFHQGCNSPAGRDGPRGSQKDVCNCNCLHLCFGVIKHLSWKVKSFTRCVCQCGRYMTSINLLQYGFWCEANQLRFAKIPGSIKVVDQVQLANILETGVKNLNKDLQSLIWNSVLLRNCRTTVEQLWKRLPVSMPGSPWQTKCGAACRFLLPPCITCYCIPLHCITLHPCMCLQVESRTSVLHVCFFGWQ